VEVKRFDVWLVNLDPTIGSEIKKTRPCLIVSPDEMNRHIYPLIAYRNQTNLTDVRFALEKSR
jgi:mRNA-degrading endonuclease toxin of MazEF toxin-antitoxin module